MKMGKLLKGFKKLLLAMLAIVAVTIIGFSVEAKAAAPTVNVTASTDGTLKYNVSGEALKSLDITIGSSTKVISISANGIADSNQNDCLALGDHLLDKKFIIEHVAVNNGGKTGTSKSAFSTGDFNISASGASGAATITGGPAKSANIYTLTYKDTTNIVYGVNYTLDSGVSAKDSSGKIVYAYDNANIKIVPDVYEDVFASKVDWKIDNGDSSFSPSPFEFTYKVNASSGSGVLTPSGYKVAIEAVPDARNNYKYTFYALTDPDTISPKYSWQVYKYNSKTDKYDKDGSASSANPMKKTFGTGSYEVVLTATLGSDSAYTFEDLNFTSEDPDIKIPSTIILNVGETTNITATANDTDIFDKDYLDDIILTFDGNSYTSGSDTKEYVIEESSKATGVGNSGKTATIALAANKNNVTYTGSKLTLKVEYDGYESNTATIKIFKKPLMEKVVNSGSTQTASFTVPEHVASNGNDMTVTGYKVCVLDTSNNLLKKCDDIVNVDSFSSGSKTVTVKLSDYWDVIQDVAFEKAASGSSFEFKIGLIPCGKINNSGEVIEAKTTGENLLIAPAGNFTVYRLNLTADAGITIVPPTATIRNSKTVNKYWGFDGESVEIKTTGGEVGYWTQAGNKITGTEGKTSYTHKFSSSTGNNNIGIVSKAKAAANDAAAGGAADASGKDKVPKTAESNAPIALLFILVLAAMGGGYALYLQFKPSLVKSSKSSDKHKY